MRRDYPNLIRYSRKANNNKHHHCPCSANNECYMTSFPQPTAPPPWALFLPIIYSCDKYLYINAKIQTIGSLSKHNTGQRSPNKNPPCGGFLLIHIMRRQELIKTN